LGDRKTLHLYDHEINWFKLIERYKIEGVIGYENCYGSWDVENYANRYTESY
jgi:hypothetical protein